MILKTFTQDEIKREVKSVVAECDLKGNGLTQKYSKQLTNRKVKDNTILGVHKYNIKGNTVYMVVTKRIYNNSPRRAGELVFNYYVSVLNPVTGKYSYVTPYFDCLGYKVRGYQMFSEQFLQRLKERDNKDFPDLLRDIGQETIVWIPKGEDDELEGSWGSYRLFGCKNGDCFTVKTMVTNDMLYDSQLPAGVTLSENRTNYETYKRQICSVI